MYSVFVKNIDSFVKNKQAKQICIMESCLLCLDVKKDIEVHLRRDSSKWQEFNITSVIEKHFWPLNDIQLTSWICTSCWRMVEDFHKFYLRIEDAHMKFKIIKVEKEEIAEYNLQETELPTDQQMQQEGRRKNTTPKQACQVVEQNTVEDICEDDAEVKNEPMMELNEEQWENSLDNYASDSDASDKDYQTVANSNNKRRSDFGLNSKCKNNDKFIAEHFKQMRCELCQEPFANFSAMKKHFAAKHNQRGYVVCCKRKFSDRFHLVDHLHLHLNPNHFMCNHCGKTMSDRRTIKRHIITEHLPNGADKKYSCDICDVSFKEEYVLCIHKSIHLPEESKVFPCSDCEESYKSFYPLYEHMKAAHLKKFFKTCYICGKQIICCRDFETHMNKHEGKPHSRIYCNLCGLGLTTESGLRRHQKSQHPADGKRDYHCPHCPKISPTAKALRKHIDTVHSASFDHQCTICEKLFKRKSVLKEHIAAHTGTPLYVCPWCPKTFYSNGNMHAHRKRMHPKEWEEAKLQKYSENFQPSFINNTAERNE